MLDTLVSSKTRLKLLLRLFLNPNSSAHLRGMAEEFDESTNAIRLELNRFEEAGMLISESQGNKKYFKANSAHSLFPDIQNLIKKHIGIDHIIEKVIIKLGDLEEVYLTGDYAAGKDSGIIDLIFVGDIDKAYLLSLVNKAEPLINRKVRFITYTRKEWSALQSCAKKNLLLWEGSNN